MKLQLLLTIFFTIASAVEASNVKATPIEKVTKLLQGLQAKITEEGKKEAAAYDKFACFCKEQADEKLYSIEKSTGKIDKLAAQIKGLDADIAELNGDVGKLSQKVTGLEGDIKREADARATDHDEYLSRAKDLSEAIDACGAAIEAMKDSKGGLKDAKVNLVQVHALLMATASRQAVPAQTLALIEQLGEQKQAPAKYTFQGNQIIELLENLQASLKKNKAGMDTDEFDVKSIYEKEALGNTNEKKFAQKEKDEKSALAEEKTDAMMDAKESKDEETQDRAADQSFLDTVTAECEGKATLFDQRSKTRADELTAMTGAIEELAKGVQPNEGANKNLVGLVQAPSFLQIRGRTLQQNGNRAVEKVQELLQEAASSLDSSVLRSAAARVMVSADHFVKVRTLIKDLINKLADDAKAEAEQKSFCDKAMNDALTNRDESKSNQEAAQAKIATLTSTKKDLISDMADLEKNVAANKKALNEATELRNDEKEENEATVASAKEGQESTNLAMGLLKDFYSGAFVQTASKYTPPNSDRDGKTVADLAPEFATEEYHGAQGESKGIIGILEVIVSDFDRTIKTVTDNEKAAQDAFDKFEKESNDDNDNMGNTRDKKEGKLKETKASILEQKQAHKDATDIFDSAEEKLDDLKSSCVEGEETWEERAAARKKEIEALKEAQNVLDEWQA